MCLNKQQKNQGLPSLQPAKRLFKAVDCLNQTTEERNTNPTNWPRPTNSMWGEVDTSPWPKQINSMRGWRMGRVGSWPPKKFAARQKTPKWALLSTTISQKGPCATTLTWASQPDILVDSCWGLCMQLQGVCGGGQSHSFRQRHRPLAFQPLGG